MEDFANQTDDENLVLLGLDFFDGSSIQVERFRSDANISFPILTKGKTLGEELGLIDRTHFIVIGPRSLIRYTTKDDTNVYKPMDTNGLQEAIDGALSEIGGKFSALFGAGH